MFRHEASRLRSPPGGVVAPLAWCAEKKSMPERSEHRCRAESGNPIKTERSTKQVVSEVTTRNMVVW